MATSNIYDLTDNWNNVATTFTGFKLNVTDTASASGSLLMNLLKGSVSQFSVNKFGAVQAGDGAASLTVGTPGISFVGASQVGFRRHSTFGCIFTASGADIWYAAASSINMRSNGNYGWSSSTSPEGAQDLYMERSAAGVMNLRQTGSAYGFINAAGYRLTSDSFNAQTGTTYTLVAADNGKTITLNNAAAITLTVPSGLGQGFSCTIIQLGAGQVTVSAGAGATVNSYSSLTKLSGQHASATLTAYAADTFNLAGTLSA